MGRNSKSLLRCPVATLETLLLNEQYLGYSALVFVDLDPCPIDPSSILVSGSRDVKENVVVPG